MAGLVTKFASVGSATMASRVLGFFREAVIASLLGAGPVADAFYAAFRFPNLFRRLFAEGAFNSAFVPLFAKELEGEGEGAAKLFAEQVLSVLVCILLALSAIAMIFTPLLVETVIASRFDPASEKFELTVTMTRIMFPYLMAMSLVAMFSGVLNSLRRYFLAAFAPVLLNVAMIAALGLAWLAGSGPREIGLWLSWSVIISGVLQLLLLVEGVRRQGFGLSWRMPAFTPAVRRLLWLALPAAVTGGITQVNLLVGQNIASGQEGAIAVINYADRLFQLPLGIITNAIAVVLLAELARTLRAGNLDDAMHLQNRSLEFGLGLVLPAMVGFLILPEALLALVYERGAFGRETTLLSAGVLAGFAAGLPAFTLIAIFRPGFYAREDMKTPMWGAGANALTNIVLSLLLFPRYGPAGIAVATSVAGWVNAAFLGWILWRKALFRPSAALLRRLGLIVVASAATAAMLLAYKGAFGVQMLDGGIGERLGLVVGAIVLAMIVYFGLVIATGAIDRKEFKAIFRRKRGARPAPAPGADATGSG
ncbi:MAG: murein biosynthesis integral membrane protein MurJ [Nitratireductor sp.]|nr:murein biosynthesis integral membrane protein MurJ [Nitratireductor sp.]